MKFFCFAFFFFARLLGRVFLVFLLSSIVRYGDFGSSATSIMGAEDDPDDDWNNDNNSLKIECLGVGS